MSRHPTVFVTGATGQLGRLVIEALLRALPPEAIGAGVRDPDTAAAAALRQRGVAVRVADYARPATLDTALTGVERLLLVSGSEVGRRRAQHRNVIAAAQRAGAGLIAYTSILHADTTPIALADEHRDTEAALAEAGVPHVLLRNGWYVENFAGRVAGALASGVLEGAAGDGRISAAPRADYAEAAAAVLTGEGHAGRTYELAGDEPFTLAELAAAAATATNRPVGYREVAPEALAAALAGAGVPAAFARMLAEIDAQTATDALFDDGGDLARLIGRPTTPLRQTIGALTGA